MVTEATSGTIAFTEHVRVLLSKVDNVHFDESGPG
jgi:hypothetical protein